MTVFLKAATVAAALLIPFAGAEAATFDFSGPAGTAPSYSYNVDGIGLTVTAQSYLVQAPLAVTRASGGHGVNAGRFDSNELDGFGVNEVLIFTFDQEVTLGDVAFSSVGLFDTFSFFAGANTPWDFSGAALASNFDLSGYTGTVFGIGTINPLSSFRIASLEATAKDVTAPVPLPAAGFVLLGGVAALAGLRRRKS